MTESILQEKRCRGGGGRSSHAVHILGIQHLYVNYSMLETCSAGVGGRVCHEVGDVVACIVLFFFMNDL